MISVNFKAIAPRITENELERLSADNPEAKFEIDREGYLVAMPPTGGVTGEKNSNLLIQVGNWNLKAKLGKVFDSSTGFRLSNGAIRSPDITWIEISRWNQLTLKQQTKFPPIDPDFVIELMSHPPLSPLLGGMKGGLQAKMSEYINCGVKLGWLINPDDKQVEIYRIGQNKEVLNNPRTLIGENILPNLIVDLTEIL